MKLINIYSNKIIWTDFKPPYWQLLFHMAAPLTMPYHHIDKIVKMLKLFRDN